MASYRGITLIIGPMFACKTKKLINCIDRHMIAKKSCVVVRHAFDTRYDLANNRNCDETCGKSCEVFCCKNQDATPDNVLQKPFIRTHDEIYYRKCPIYSSNDLKSLIDVLKQYDVIGIDEGQFFADLTENCSLLASLGKTVYVAGLSSDYKQEVFPAIAALLPRCSDVKFVKSICFYCQNDASFTKRTSAENDTVVIGADDKYIPVCEQCLSAKAD